MAQKRIPKHPRAWIDARKRHKLSHAHAQMAGELGMNPRKLGKLDNHHQGPWFSDIQSLVVALGGSVTEREGSCVKITLQVSSGTVTALTQAKRLSAIRSKRLASCWNV